MTCRKLAILSTPVLVFTTVSLNAQPPDVLWMQTYGGRGNDVGESVVECGSGGYAIVGGTNSYDPSSWYVYLVRTDDLGDTLWSRVYGGNGQEIGESIIETSDGDLVMTGQTTSFPEDESNVYFIKTDSSGIRSQEKSLSVGYIDQPLNIKQSSEGGFIIVGYTVLEYEDYHQDVMILKTDDEGYFEWARTYGGPGDDQASCVCEVPGDGYYVIGTTKESSFQPTDVWLLKTDYGGDTVFTRTYGGYAGDSGAWIENTADGGFVITGSTNPEGGGGWEVYLVKTDADGVLEWDESYGGWEWDTGLYVQQTMDGNYFIAGYTLSFGRGDVDYYFLKVDMNGSLIWSTPFGGISTDLGISGLQSSDGGYVMIGYTGSYGHGLMDLMLVKLEPEQVYIDDGDYKSRPAGFSLDPNTPNPFNASTIISYALSEAALVKIDIFDMLGHRVETLLRKELAPGYHEAIWDAGDRPSGVYFYRLEAGQHTETRKMMLLK
jgi:hypothetical protein